MLYVEPGASFLQTTGLKWGASTPGLHKPCPCWQRSPSASGTFLWAAPVWLSGWPMGYAKKNIIPRTDFVKGVQSFQRLTHAAQNSARRSPDYLSAVHCLLHSPPSMCRRHGQKARSSYLLPTLGKKTKATFEHWHLEFLKFVCPLWRFSTTAPVSLKKKKIPEEMTRCLEATLLCTPVQNTCPQQTFVDWDTWQSKNVPTQNTPKIPWSNMETKSNT